MWYQVVTHSPMDEDQLTQLIVRHLDERLRDGGGGKPGSGHTAERRYYNEETGKDEERPDWLAVDGVLDCRELARAIAGALFGAAEIATLRQLVSAYSLNIEAGARREGVFPDTSPKLASELAELGALLKKLGWIAAVR